MKEYKNFIKKQYKKLINNIEELQKEQQKIIEKRKNKFYTNYIEKQEDLEDIYYIDLLISENYTLIDELKQFKGGC